MNFLRKLINPTAAEVSTITLTRACRVQTATGEMINGELGEVVQVTRRTAAELCAMDAATDHASDTAAAARATSLAALLPPPGEARPVPPEWEKLPPCFTDWFRLNEAGLLLLRRRDEIERRLIERGSRLVPPESLGEVGKGITDQRDRDRAVAAVAKACTIATIDDEHLARCRYLRDALERSKNSFEDWQDRHAGQLAKLRFECSRYTIERHGEIVRAYRELAAVGRELFECRVRPLNLAPWKISELHRGSADYARFSIQPPTLQNLRLAWADPGESPVHYLDIPVSTMVSLIEDFSSIAAEAAALLKQAKAELKKAQAVA